MRLVRITLVRHPASFLLICVPPHMGPPRQILPPNVLTLFSAATGPWRPFAGISVLARQARQHTPVKGRSDNVLTGFAALRAQVPSAGGLHHESRLERAA